MYTGPCYDYGWTMNIEDILDNIELVLYKCIPSILNLIIVIIW